MISRRDALKGAATLAAATAMPMSLPVPESPLAICIERPQTVYWLGNQGFYALTERGLTALSDPIAEK